MIIDAHAHLCTPISVQGLRSYLMASGGQHSMQWLKAKLSQNELDNALAGNLAAMDEVGTDMQLLSPRPFTLMHSHHRASDIRLWVELQNDLIHDNVQNYPDRFRGVCALPQVAGAPVEVVFEELDRCVDDLGFVGILLNPDPSEGQGTSPRLDDPYWFPLWEKVIEKKVPVHIHSAGCCGRETYDEHFASEESLAITSIAHSDVFERFPALHMMISHGGGSIPYQIGRWRSHWQVSLAAKEPKVASYLKAFSAALRAGGHPPPAPPELTTFDDMLKRFYFDCDVHSKSALELLLKVVGPDRVLFGTERPGSGGGIDPDTGRSFDDFKYTIDRIDFLNDQGRSAIYEGNARAIFPRLQISQAIVDQ